MAVNPRSPRARIDPLKPLASAQAPWTNTTVGVALVADVASVIVTPPG